VKVRKRFFNKFLQISWKIAKKFPEIFRLKFPNS